jgi:glutamate--cysteine ligase
VSSGARVHANRVESYLRTNCFTAPTHSMRALRFGAELELIALDAVTRRPAPILDSDVPCTLPVAREVGARFGWLEHRSEKGASRFVADSGAALTFEPGGQLEYASATHRSVDAVIRELIAVETALRERATEHGISLLACGVDPVNGPDHAPLQLDAERYRRMGAYFGRIGRAGVRMMRQTASLQLCVGGVDVAARWRLANAIAPVLVAMFANSARYAGTDTHCVSYRAETWRGVDPLRTGILEGRDPLREYAAFALGAPAFLIGADDEPALPLGELAGDAVSDPALATHLSTLFPEVRPRGYLELRSLDAIDARHHAAALVMAAGLLADDVAARCAAEIVGEPSASLLLRAGRIGLAEPSLARCAEDLADVALSGCARLGGSIVSDQLLAQARASLDELIGSSRPTEDALTVMQ